MLFFISLLKDYICNFFESLLPQALPSVWNIARRQFFTLSPIHSFFRFIDEYLWPEVGRRFQFFFIEYLLFTLYSVFWSVFGKPYDYVTDKILEFFNLKK